MGLRLSIVGGTLVARSARAFMRPVARRAITTKRTDWAGEARSICQGATEDKLEALGYALPPASTPKGSYAMYSRAGDMLFLAGHIPVRPDGSICTGVVGKDLKKSQGTDAARLCGLAILRTLSDAVGLDNVKQVHKLVAFVACSDDFENQPGVVNGCSDLLFEVLGCVEIKILWRVRAGSPHRPPRHRRDARSMAWRCQFPNDLVKNYRCTRRTG